MTDGFTKVLHNVTSFSLIALLLGFGLFFLGFFTEGEKGLLSMEASFYIIGATMLGRAICWAIESDRF